MQNHSHNYYNKKLKPIGRTLRQRMTKAEVCLWKYALKKRKCRGYTFNRQRPVLDYVADFMCKDLKLIIEVDGSTHDHPQAKKRDKHRQRELENAGFYVLRFTDEEVLKNMDSVIREIEWVIDYLEDEPPA